jgi:hypothetical protein
MKNVVAGFALTLLLTGGTLAGQQTTLDVLRGKTASEAQAQQCEAPGARCSQANDCCSNNCSFGPHGENSHGMCR